MKTRAEYTPEQTKLALEFVAGKADILRMLLSRLAQDLEGKVDKHLIYQAWAAEALVEVIGAAADRAADSPLSGGYEEWLFGQDFEKAGAA